jgi:hypothetical protein
MQKADEPLTRTSINLYEKDYHILKKRYGWGWSEVVRDKIREWLRKDQIDGQRDRPFDGH